MSGGAAARSALVVVEIALTLMLVLSAAILTKSFIRLMHADPGFNPKGVLTLRLLAPPSQNPEAVFRLVEQRLSSIPGVQTVAVTNNLPLIADRASASRFNVPGSRLINPDALPGAQIRTVSPAYFGAMQIALKAGRTFVEQDVHRSVVVINETMAKRFWPGRNPVGLSFISSPWGPNPTWSTIIGVVADVKQFGLDSEPSFDMYFPSVSGQFLVLKTNGDPIAFSAVVYRTIRSVAPQLAISDMRSMDQIANASALTRRWTMGLLVSFGVFAFLALVGIFGVISWAVARRTREIGIRMALGSGKIQILLLFLRYGLVLSLTGVGFGVLASFAIRRSLSTLVYGVSTADPVLFTFVPAVMLLVSLAACYIPAQRAAKADPLTSLRTE